MRRISYALAILAVSLLLLNGGCYTVLKHPTGSSVVQEDTYYRSCADCHADAAYYHPYSQPYYSSHYGWGSYYGSPWWYDDYYWYDPCYDPCYDYDDDYIGPKVETDTRHLWGSSGWASGGWGFTKPGSGTSSTPPPASQPSQKSDKKKTKAKEKEKEKEKPKEKEKEKPKDERDLWKKPKKGF
jgi:hypothetical protein